MPDLKINGKLNETVNLGIAVRNDEPGLVTIFEKAIDTIDTRTRQEIINHWISVRYEQGLDYKLILEIASVVGVVLLVLIYRQWILAK